MEVTSILDSIKAMLGISTDDSSFDRELIIFINGALMILHQLGVGPVGYKIQDASNEWSEFLLNRDDLDSVKTVVFLRVKLLFDPPLNSFAVTSIKEQIAEYDWRISINHAPTPVE